MAGRPSPLRYAFGIGLLLNVVLVAVSANALYQERRRGEADALVATRNLCQALDTSVSELIARTDQALLTVKEMLEGALAAGDPDEERVERLVAQQHTHLRDVDSLRIALATGEIRYGTGVRASPGRNVVDREYFRLHRDAATPGLVISEPVLGKISGKWVVILSRRLDHPDGRFGGVVYAGVLVSSLTKLFEQIDLGSNGVVALRDERLRLVARYPETDPSGHPVTGRVVSPEMTQLLGAGASSASYFARGGADGVHRAFTFRRVGGWPLILIVGIARDTYLASWRSSVRSVSLLVVISLAATGVALGALRRAARREEEATRELARQEERYRIVADHTTDWEYWLAPDGAFVYCSPSCVKVTGRTAAEFYADPELLQGVLHPDDRGPFQAHRAEVAHTRTGGGLVMRVRHTDGRTRWIHHVCEPIIDAAGAFLGARGSNRDITETKEQQDLVLAQKRELEATLARTKRLEGLISLCVYCKRINGDNRSWERLEKYLSDHSDAQFSHGICPECYDKHATD